MILDTDKPPAPVWGSGGVLRSPYNLGCPAPGAGLAGVCKPCRGYDGAARPRPGPDAHRPRAEPFRGGRHGDADLARTGHEQPGGGDAPSLETGREVHGVGHRSQGDDGAWRTCAIMGAAGRCHPYRQAVSPGPRCDGSRRTRPGSPRRPSQGVTGAFTFQRTIVSVVFH